METIESKVKDFLPIVFQNKKYIPAKDFWVAMEENFKEINSEFYSAIVNLTKRGVLYNESSNYYYKR